MEKSLYIKNLSFIWNNDQYTLKKKNFLIIDIDFNKIFILSLKIFKKLFSYF